MKKYWKSLEERKGNSDSMQNQNIEDKGNLAQVLDVFDDGVVNSKSSRRDFLKLCGYSLAISTVVSSCENSVQKAIPYLIKPEEVIPGRANYYASSYVQGSEYCSILIKVRDGRPIKIEGNHISDIIGGGTSARVQASVLGLYDTHRYKNPVKGKEKISWEQLDQEVSQKLKSCKDENGQIVLLTPTIYSPSTHKAIQRFLNQYPSARWVQYDSISASGILSANEKSFGKKVLPDYRFDRAEMIVSFGADFLGSWLSPTEYIRQYAKNRRLEEGTKKMSHHIQYESHLSLSGSNADRRIQIGPSEEGLIIANLFNEILKAKGNTSYSLPNSPGKVEGLAKELVMHKGKSLVVSGANDENIQMLVNAINEELGNIGRTILFDHALKVKQGKDEEMHQLVADLNAGKVKVLLCYGVNPVYDYPEAEQFSMGLKNTSFTLSFAHSPDETSDLCGYVAPDHHFLESWNDVEPKNGKYSLAQPGIHPLYDTRQAQSSLLKWAGDSDDFHALIQAYWEENLFPKQSLYSDFNAFWNYTLQQGVFEPSQRKEEVLAFDASGIEQALTAIQKASLGNGIDLVCYESLSLGDGRHANNPWLQELPDPISRICWDNYLSISPKQAREMGLVTGNLVEVKGMMLPVYVQPGQAYGTVAVALGYGRTMCGKVGQGVGRNAFHLLTIKDGIRQYYTSDIQLKKLEGDHPLVTTQTHHSMEGRAIVREATLDEYRKNPTAGNEPSLHDLDSKAAIYPKPEFPDHRWGMVVDLNACVGCGACVTACQAENNVPVVGKNEVRRVHEMHWIRIDRYFSGDEEEPKVSFQPVMCQHCDIAPCENVCPVAATNHNSEGINQMIYNRCIGTRYCNNNCPYKVRRFNWFNYTEADSMPNNLHDIAEMTGDLKRMVLNPDVTVRAKGVIEKCSLCLQRIQEGKLKAKMEGRAVRDGDIQTACEQACPAGAIIFGDLTDAKSRVSRLASIERNYHLLEEVGTLPSVSYLTKIRNKKNNES